MPDGLTVSQRAAATHPGGPVRLLGGAGTGKTTTLVARFAWLVDRGHAPEEILVLTHSSSSADALRARLEASLERPYEELSVHTVSSLCLRILNEESLEAGLDPFLVPATAADRLALLLERIDELTLRHHDFQGRPAALMASFVARIDRLKDELITAEAYARWAETLVADRDGDGDGDGDAHGDGDGDPAPGRATRAAREREFAALYADHDRLLRERGTLDFGDLLIHTRELLVARPHVRQRVQERFGQLLVDEYQDLGLAAREIVELLSAHGQLTVAGDDDESIHRFRGASTKNLSDFVARHPDAQTITLTESQRCPQRILDAATAVVAANPDRLEKALTGRPGGEVAFWRASNERSQAQGVAADVETLITRQGVAPESIGLLVRSVTGEGQALAVALEERAVPYRIVGAAAFFQRAEIRDVLAWLRLLGDPRDAGAVVRALARPPVELRAVDLARTIQIARRRKLDMVSALVAATESPQIPPEARERILGFLKLYRSAMAALDNTRPDLFVHRLIERLGLRRQQLFAAQADVVDRLVNLAKLSELASTFVRRSPQATPREFGRYIAAVAEAGMREEEASAEAHPRAVRVMTMHAAQGLEFDHVYLLGLHSARMPGARRVALEPIADALLVEPLPPDSRATHVAEMRRLLHVGMTRARLRLVLSYPARSDKGAQQPPSPLVEDARTALAAEWEDVEEELFGPAESLHSMFRMMRDEVLDTVGRIGGRLGELRLDTDLDISHGAVRYLELIKLAALLERPAGQTVSDALPDINARLLQAATSMQSEIFQTSPLDEMLLDAERSEHGRAQTLAQRDEPSLEAFLPRRGDGLVLSASDIETYRTCPLKYKFARVFRIPQEPTLHQRFGILVHQVLERYHASQAGSLPEMFGLLEAGWRRGGFGDSEEERQLKDKANRALTLYHQRFATEAAEPVWFERAFSFRLGPHHLRGRVDRVDRLPDGGYELIDYKTGRPKTASQLRDDVQLSLYAVGAREAWQLEAALQSYYYVLDDQKVAVPHESDSEWIRDTVLEVGEGILAQGFEPTPSYAACSMCDYRIVCPAAER
ncbi:MAG TPA: ATP-dependent DNA helicase [Solirubrobacteraceae bacterium]|nr:ATP-dependent DNA helicase [Solirubrobacteraceae bacterium]